MERLAVRSGRRLVAVLVAAALLATACGSGPTPAPSPSPTPSPAASASIASPSASSSARAPTAAELTELTRQITEQVVALRGLPATTPVTPVLLDETGLAQRLKAEFAKQNTPAYIAAEEGLLKRLGLLQRGASLTDLELDLLGSQVLGFYDDATKALYVVARSGGVGPTEKYTMAHEIDHALQDQHFGLKKVSPDAPDQSDRTLAAHALLEGDATLVGTLWATQHLTAAELGEIVAAGQDPAQQAVLDKVPPIIKEPLLFEYTQGLQLALGLEQSGGWSAVDRAFTAPPVSTEQVLHPEKYAAHEAPVAVSLPKDLAAKMGAGWRLALEDTLGELQLRIWLASSTTNAAAADGAAAGWGGDRIGYLTGPGGADAVVSWSTWDTPKDAAEFLDAAGRLVAAGDSPGTVIKASDREVVVILAGDGPTLDAAVGAAGFPR